MRSDTVVDARVQFDPLHAERARRGRLADHRGIAAQPALHMRDPVHAGFNGSAAILGNRHIWHWGSGLGVGPVDGISEAVDRAMHVLRDVMP